MMSWGSLKLFVEFSPALRDQVSRRVSRMVLRGSSTAVRTSTLLNFGSEGPVLTIPESLEHGVGGIWYKLVKSGTSLFSLVIVGRVIEA